MEPGAGASAPELEEELEPPLLEVVVLLPPPPPQLVSVEPLYQGVFTLVVVWPLPTCEVESTGSASLMVLLSWNPVKKALAGLKLGSRASVAFSKHRQAL